MKKFKNLCLFSMAMIVLFMTGCEDVEGTTTFFGSVVCNPNPASEGTNVTISIGPYNSGNSTIGISTSTEINGKNVVKSVSYFIDDVLVAKSYDKKSNYSASYKLVDIPKGNHTVKAICNSNFKDFKINSVINTAILTVN